MSEQKITIIQRAREFVREAVLGKVMPDDPYASEDWLGVGAANTGFPDRNNIGNKTREET